MNTNLKDLSATELRALVTKQADTISQKDRQITHLSKNAQNWVQKFDEQQNKVAESVIKKFELEFERERNELHAKLVKMSEVQTKLANRCRNLQALLKSTTSVAAEKIVNQPAEINMLSEPASVSEIEFSNEMRVKLAKYAT